MIASILVCFPFQIWYINHLTYRWLFFNDISLWNIFCLLEANFLSLTFRTWYPPHGWSGNFSSHKVRLHMHTKRKKVKPGGRRGGIIVIVRRKRGMEWWLFWEVDITLQFFFFLPEFSRRSRKNPGSGIANRKMWYRYPRLRFWWLLIGEYHRYTHSESPRSNSYFTDKVSTFILWQISNQSLKY